MWNCSSLTHTALLDITCAVALLLHSHAVDIPKSEAREASSRQFSKVADDTRTCSLRTASSKCWRLVKSLMKFSGISKYNRDPVLPRLFDIDGSPVTSHIQDAEVELAHFANIDSYVLCKG